MSAVGREKLTFTEQLIKLNGGLDAIPRKGKWGKLLSAHGVSRTDEFRRIENLPRRKWETDPSIQEATKALTDWLRLPGGEDPCSAECKCPRELWPNQAAALIESVTVQGNFGPHGVGRGKALISILAATVFDAQRPVLLVPAQLRDQTLRKVLPMLRNHWRVNPRIKVIGYSELSLAKNKDMFAFLAPDLIILDEVHAVKNPQAARTKRLREYLRTNPTTRVVALSGTMTRRSIRDYWQILLWSLKPDLCPLPASWREMSDWADALDEGVQEQDRLAPGALMKLCEGGEDPRDGYRRRLTETPGVVATSESELGVSLRIEERRVVVPGRVLGHLRDMRANWTTPYGDEITEAVELWRHARELACGFHYRWDPVPPSEWLEARREWKKTVREILKRNRQGLDSELLVTNEVTRRSGTGEDTLTTRAWRAWRDIRDTFTPNTVAEWVSDFALRDAAFWLQSDGAGIAWTEQVAFGEKLAELAGVPYFGAGMKASALILDHKGPCVASIAAHGTGKNLQHWSSNLVTSPPSSGKTWEQLLGRTHRQGQLADEVSVEVFLHAEELRASLSQAINDARYIEQTTGSRQKLLYANIVAEGF